MDRLYFRQLLAGRDIASDSMLARQMVNFAYLIGDRDTREVVVVDPAYDVEGILGIVGEDGMRLTGVLATHYHADHIGGDMMGFQVQGVADLLESEPELKVHIQRTERPWVQRSTGLSDVDLAIHDSGESVQVGSVVIELIHTPGHTPGSQCFLVNGQALVAGDTLFLEGCGRTDLPGGDPRELYLSLTQRLAKIPDSAILFPGHLYSREPSAPMGETRRTNFVFKPKSEQQWLTAFG